MPIIDAGTGEIRRAEIFVAVLGASSYTYAEATWSQQLPDWIASHVRCFEFMGCVPALLVPDNLKSAIKLACRYEPEATSTYEVSVGMQESPSVGIEFSPPILDQEIVGGSRPAKPRGTVEIRPVMEVPGLPEEALT